MVFLTGARFLAAPCIAMLVIAGTAWGIPEDTTSLKPLSRDRAYFGFSMAVQSLDGIRAIRVARLVPGSPADHAGLRQGDLIISTNGQSVTANTVYQALHEMDQYKAGEIIHLGIRRGSEPMELVIKTIGYTQGDFDKLNDWLLSAESRKRAAEISNRPAAACKDGASEPDIASERWAHFLMKTLRGASDAHMTVRRPADGGPLTFDVSPAEVGLPQGFVAADLPKGMRELVERLRAGDALHYRLEASGGTFSIRSEGAVPSYLSEEASRIERD